MPALHAGEVKHYYFAPRPQQFGISTSVGLPNFPSYASGHSTFQQAAADVLSYMVEKSKFLLMIMQGSL